MTETIALPWPGFEPGLSRPQREVLTTIRSRPLHQHAQMQSIIAAIWICERWWMHYVAPYDSPRDTPGCRDRLTFTVNYLFYFQTSELNCKNLALGIVPRKNSRTLSTIPIFCIKLLPNIVVGCVITVYYHNIPAILTKFAQILLFRKVFFIAKMVIHATLAPAACAPL